MNKATRTLVERLANALFPVAGWIALKALPTDLMTRSAWRATTKAPAITDLAITAFLDELDRQDAELQPLRQRWARLARSPLAGQRIVGRLAGWRTRRRLQTGRGKVSFGIVESGNVALSERQNVARLGPMTVAMSRAELYKPCLSVLVRIAKQRGLIDSTGASTSLPPKAWEDLALDLRQEGPFPGWPDRAPSPTLFLHQFLKDIMYCAIGYRFGQTGLNEVVAVEAGERRRPGNHWSREDAADAVRELERRMVLPPL